MGIESIAALAVPSSAATGAASPISAAGATGSGGGDLFSSVSSALESVSEAHGKVDELSVEAATGDLTAVHELTIATAEAQLLTQLTVEVRNRAVESFNEIMRMQV